MTIDDIRRKIESERYSAEIGIASGRETFETLIRDSAEFRELKAYLHAHRQHIIEVVNLVKRQSEQRIDYRYENPNDTALATYLLGLSIVDPRTAEAAAGFALVAPNTWWVSKIASDLINRTEATLTLSTAATYPWTFFDAVARTFFKTPSATFQASLVSNFFLQDILRMSDQVTEVICTNLASVVVPANIKTSVDAATPGSFTKPVKWELAA